MERQGPLIDKEDVKKIIEMNAKIVACNCEVLVLLCRPVLVFNTDKEAGDA